MRFRRLCNLSLTFEQDGALIVRSPTEGFAVRIPPAAVGLLSLCHRACSEDEVAATLGEPARPLFRALCEAGILVPPERADDTPHFYATFETIDAQRRMIGDRPRMEAYRRAIQEAVEPGMAVLDAGTGSGVLAMMAARAGARVVYAVDRSEFLDLAAMLLRHNGLEDRVRLLRADLAEVQLPEKVDLVITETFGALALVEGSPPDLQRCCDRNLAPGGRVLPAGIDFHLAPLAVPGPTRALLEPFRAHPGLDLSPLEERSLQQAVSTCIAPGDLAHPGQHLAHLDFPAGGMRLESSAHFQGLPGEIHGLVGWFDLRLGPDLTLPTGPGAPLTHWKQALLPLPAVPVRDPLEVEVKIGPAPDNRRKLLIHSTLRSPAGTRAFQHRL